MNKTIYTDGDQTTPILKAKELGFTCVRCHHDYNNYELMSELINTARGGGIKLWFSMDWDFDRMVTSHRKEILARYNFLYENRDVVLGLCAEETEFHPDVNIGKIWPRELVKAHFDFVHANYPEFDTQIIVCDHTRASWAKQACFEYYLDTPDNHNSSRADYLANLDSFLDNIGGANTSLGLCLKARDLDVNAETLQWQVDQFRAALERRAISLPLVEIVAWVWDWDTHPEIPTLGDTPSIQQAWRSLTLTPSPPPPLPPETKSFSEEMAGTLVSASGRKFKFSGMMVEVK